MLRKIVLLLLVLIPFSLVYAQNATPEVTPQANGGDVSGQYVGQPDLAAPEFPSGLEWLNVAAPLTMASLRGKIVILDFWTYGCINCIHMFPILQQLEDKYGSALAVISIHSAKFDNEGNTQNIREIVERYGITHPVINDNQFVLWRTYGVNAWPTFYVIDPRGNVLARQAGEIPFDAFDKLMGGMVNYWDGIGELSRTPLPIKLEGSNLPAGLLDFPGKIVADTSGNRLFIADSSHNRVIIADLNTDKVLDVIGSSKQGLDNGAFETATFSTPQGMALSADGKTLYIADMGNNVIRAADLSARTVSTVAGTGKLFYGMAIDNQPLPALSADLSSPWDLAMGDANILYVAMAGVHQIWALHLDAQKIIPLIGDGQEGLLSDSLVGSQLAQPSGIFYRDGILYIADSESSTIRAADIAKRTVTTIAGTTAEGNLFDFGDKDGVVGTSRLQHPLGITGGADGLLYVTDTYNSRIKVLDPKTNTITTLSGQGEGGGFKDGAESDAEFNEPGGLTLVGDKLYVADTNNQAIRVIDLQSQQVSTIQFPNPDKLQIGDETTIVGGNAAQAQVITLPAQTVASGEGTIHVQITLPENYQINPDAPSGSEWNNEGSAIDIPEAGRMQSFNTADFSVPIMLTAGSDTLHGYLTTYYCEHDQQSLCFIDDVQIEVPVTVSADATSKEITIARTITPPQVDATSGITGS
ncbi:MAG TPA: thioredoxin-like domain-containing protein [Phototrophicaceae bacterium]|nr:thioredoxin-like domain-containing protein [Phototrophicaceae bacterium]